MNAFRRPLSRRTRRALPPAVALLATVLASALALLIPAGRSADPMVVTPPDTQTLVCPQGAASKATLVAATGDGDPIHFGPIDGAIDTQPSPVSREVTAPQRLLGSTPLAGGVYVATETQASWGACQTASSLHVLQTPDPAAATLWLTNPDARAVTVDLSLSSDTGDVTSPGARGIQIGAHATRPVALAAFGAAGHPLGVVVRTDQGRVAAIIESTGLGLTQSGPTATGTSLVIPGIAEKASSVRLLVTNSGTTRATAQVQAMVATGPFVPQGGDGVSVEASDTIVLDLTGPLEGQAAGFSITSDQPVTVTAVITRAKDTASLAAALPAKDQVVMVPADGVLQISNPQSTDVAVELAAPNAQAVTVPAGATWTGEVAAGSVRISAAQPVGAAVVVGGSETIAVIGSAVPVGGATPVPVQVDPRLR